MPRPSKLLPGLLLLALAVFAPCSGALAESVTFFPGTQYALEVHFLRGEKPGPTVMVQGGIQGDEAAGFLTAQLLSRAKVAKGTVIVVPRANPPSIHERKRAINVDLNRRFDQDYNEFYEDRLARVIRFLVSQSQALIHLHEGSGFYDTVRRSDLRGPQRYGQSVIVDSADPRRAPQLERAVRQVLAKVNEGVTPKDWAFQLFNMDTFNDRSRYLEQRKSLTYYALSRVGIPALAVEVSKNIPDLSWKVTQQLKVTALFLRQFGIELEPPRLGPEDLKAYPSRELRVLVNGSPLTAQTRTIRLDPGKPLDVRFENLPEGAAMSPVTAVFASDRPGFNLAKGPRLPLAPFQGIDVRADGVVLARAALEWKGAWPAAEAAGKPRFVCWLGGELRVVPADGELDAVQGDQLVLEGVWGSRRDEVLNLKGYVSRVGKNDGQDAGQEIILDPNSFIPKFVKHLENGDLLYEVVRETPKEPQAHFFLRVKPRVVTELTVRDQQGRAITLEWRPGKALALPPGRYVLEELRGNGPAGMVQFFAGRRPVGVGQAFIVAPSDEIVLRQATTFAEIGKMPVNSVVSEAGRALGY
ncbi:N-alpha-acetyl-L-2,4-diaminobutyric acid deacetylase [Fundidesulfovibrio magnetotacticus]|uniref:N-alpha-acetyl-L-2,4-diaminobutyric acid deacetylase n=1 Tax=Fundidesulfovibrio magnetotacticus TaxID=2730080 RepID=A0A6V8LZD6_9BACT|nr:M99 family carboxypeptidase catalytic domain-containing protein [Fundidesulfovibrio magnetotacticus]GFK95379.1 N-alpha-acetyl-L-2,4-diaminobutyric acid deacetylase [Fundidesulfovibrio magnetotacticus]